jgi:trans-aconitate methyltransferase
MGLSGLAGDLVKLLDPKVYEKILNLGCGSDQLTQTINEYGAQVTGLDQSPAMVKAAKRLFPSIHFEVGDATNFNFHFQFDAIFSNAVLHWVLDYQAAIDCMFRNLKQGGRLVLKFG